MERISPRINDVLFGRGTSVNVHPGNRQFRSLVEVHRPAFVDAQKIKQKRKIAEQIFNEIQSLQGRFLEEDMVINEAEIVDNVPSFNAVHPSILKKSWIVVEPEKALLKILKRLREKEKNVVVDLPYTAQTPNTTEEKSRSFYPQMIPSNASQPEQKFNNAYPVAELSNHPATTTHYSFAGDNVDVGQEAIDARQVNNWSSVDVFHPQSHITSDINTTPPQCTDKSMEQQTVAREGLLSKYLEGSGLNLETDAFLQAPTPQPDIDATDELCEYTLPQWIMNSKPDISLDIAATSAQSHEHVDTFIKPALLIALKLTECMLEAERDENSGHGNPIPLASIAPENVLIRARKYQHAIGESDEVRENIEFVWVMSIVGDESAIGTVMARLFAVGKVLYELFSTKYTSKEYDLPTFPMTSMDSINLFNEADNGRNTQNNRRWHRGQAGNQNSTYIARLESTGVPMPLCVLIVNLLECRHDPFCDDDAYSSFADLQLDLQMMLDNPSSFLDDMGHIINNPKLAIPDKLFGRDEELSKLEELYQSHIYSGQTTGVVISGGAGAGKSKLASHLQKVTTSSNGYFLSTKFDHNQMSLKPLSTVAYMIDALCDILLNNSQPTQLSEVENELTGALGSQPSLLGISPGLRKLMPSSESVVSAASNCVDNAVSMRYQCGELLRVISSYLKPITIVIDDIQFADQTSLLLVGSMLVNTRRNSAFFCLCHRDDEASMSGPFNEWLASLSEFSLESIKLVAITPEAVNNLISEALHLSPRLTRPLSTMLHHKTRGNPLFLRQLLDSLTEQGYIFVDMKQRRWSWDLDKITELEISESVLALLMSDIKRLPSDLQFGLQVAACIGACVTETMLDYLMIGIGINLKETLQQASQKGFMIDLVDSAMFRFAHDKIRQAAYELMSDQQRRENHMRFGLALCTESLDNIAQDEELFFAAVNQINLGGPTAVQEPSQRKVMAELNLKAGRRAIELSDYNTAFTLFEHGISFLEDDDWTLNYQLSLALYDAVAEAALIRNCLSAVTHYTDLVVLHGRCFDDKLHCLITAAQALGVAYRQEQSIKAAFAILAQFGENIFIPKEDCKMSFDIDEMNNILRSASDDMICNMHENNDKKMTSLIHLYETLAHVLQYFMPWLLQSVSLRMVELTMKHGLSSKSPLVFAHFGGVLVTSGRIIDGCRLGKLALKLVEKRGSLQYKSSVISFAYDKILWVSEPFQLIVEAHLLGYKCGKQSGDNIFAIHNLLLAILTDYVAGQALVTVEKNILDFISKLEANGFKIFFKHPILLLSQVAVLKQGMRMSGVKHVKNQPSEIEILADASLGPSVLAYGKLHLITRAFLFRQIDDVVRHFDTYEAVSDSNHQLNPHFLMGYFFEGLASFLLARQASDEVESAKWIERGQSVLTKMRCWNEHSSWNWENKMLLLEAEMLYTTGEFDRAGPLFDSAMRSARKYKFIHEEAIASELAGTFCYERGLRQKSYACLLHSVACYDKWGANAVARRVEAIIHESFRHDGDELDNTKASLLDFLVAPTQGSQMKRQGGC